MRFSYLPRFSLFVLSTLAAGCGSASSASSSSASDPGASNGGAERAIAEADIVQLDSGKLYAMSRSGSVSIVDVSVPGKLTMLSQTTLAGEPFEMYRRGNFLIAMASSAVDTNGNEYSAGYRQNVDPNAGSLVSVLDTSDSHLKRVATLKVAGEVADSRVVGDVLYLATYENAACYGCGTKPRTLVTSFDISDLSHIQQVDQQSFSSNAPDSYSLAWGSHWKRSIFVNDQRLYIGGHADIEPSSYGQSVDEGIIDVLDISDPHGKLERGARIAVAGAVLSRWQMDETDGVFRVVSQQGAGRTGNGTAMPQVATFRVDDARLINSHATFTPLATMTMKLPRQEGLRTVRFDGARAYAITYNQTDPLFTLDLSDPAKPVQRGELFMPGFMFHLEPHGDRVIGLGIDRTDSYGSLNVSLFDVHDMDHPKMLSRVAFGTPNIGEDYEILNGEVAEDQDRIQKAFRVIPFTEGRIQENLVVVPFSALVRFGSSSCTSSGGGVQLVVWNDDALQKKALLPVPGNPRRALLDNGQILAVSDSNVRAFSAADLSSAKMTADLTIGQCIPNSPYGYYGGVRQGGGGGYYDCSAGGATDPRGAFGALFVGLAIAVSRRRAKPTDRRGHRAAG